MELDKHILLRDYATAGKFSKKKIEQIETSSWGYIYPWSLEKAKKTSPPYTTWFFSGM